jgi:5'-nucleotidase / UDP-sugar diphosphatase
MFPFDAISYTPPLEGDNNALMTSFLEGSGVLVATAPDNATQTVLDVYAADVEEFAGTFVAFVPEDICHERTPGAGRSQICTIEQTIEQGGGKCRLASDALSNSLTD